MDFKSPQIRNAVGILVLFSMGCSSSGGDGSSGGATGSGGSAGGAPGSSSGTSLAGSMAQSGASGGSMASGGGTVASTFSWSTSTGGADTSGKAKTETAGGGGTGGRSNVGGTLDSSSSAAGSSAMTSGATGGTTTSGGMTDSGGTRTGGATTSGGTRTGGAISGSTTASGGTTSTGTTGPLPALTIYIAGDSTVSNYAETSASNDQAGWGQMLHEIFNTKITIDNRAAGGRTAYWFYLEGAADKILSAIRPGDYFFIQFGTNDQNETATFTVDGKEYPRYADANTTFKTQLKKYYLDPTKAKKAIPVLVTPPPRNSAYCSGGNGLAAYATAMIELGAAENVAVLDNNGKTFNYLKAICPKPTTAATESFFLGKSDGSIDGTHFQENGARKMAGFIGEEIKRIGLGLAGYLK